MAGQSNGRAKAPKKAVANGSLNGHANGHVNGHLNGHANKAKPSKSLARTSRPRKSGKTWAAVFTSTLARLAVWYSIITILFRCPKSLTNLSDASPQICKPYLHVQSFTKPYVDPYYQVYVAPQYARVEPYVHAVEQNVYAPVAAFTKDSYGKYGAHPVAQAQKYANAQWTRTVRPQIQSVQKVTKGQYDQYLGSYVDTAYDAITPYYEQVENSVVEIYHLSLLPAYEMVLPHARQAWKHGHHATTYVILPTVQSARDATWKFVARSVWPQARVLYGDNVEPQLVRIRERLGRYKDQQKIEAIVEAVESESTSVVKSIVATPSVASSASASTKSGWGMLDDFFGGDSSTATATASEVEAETPVQPKPPQLTGEELREKLNEDLRTWQTKFATAADKGAEDLETRVADITERQIESGVKGHGSALVVQLEETAQSTITKFKNFIIDVVKALPDDPVEKDLDAAYEKCAVKTRELGLVVKEKASAIRTWKASYDQETDSLVQAAVHSTVEVLDKIHGLGLQEVGMRWAWLDGVTYEDWQRYHKLRTTLTEWQAEVEAVGSKHDGLRLAHDEAVKLEDKAMSTASTMVDELVRLKDVSKWKIWAQDTTADYSNQKVPARVFKAAQEVVENVQQASSKASDAIVGSQTPTTESVASALKETASSASSKLSAAVVGSETPLSEHLASDMQSQTSKASAALSAAKESVKSGTKKVYGGAMAQAVPEARQVVFDDPIDEDDAETYSKKIQNLVADAGDRASDLSRALSEALVRPAKTQGTMESVTSLANEQYARGLAAASSIMYGTQKQPIESATSIASDKFAQAVTAASYAIYGTPTPTAIIKTVQVQASSRYNDAVKIANEQYSNAKTQLSVLVSGSTKPAHKTMLSMIDKAYSDSLAAASERLQAALQYTDSVKSYVAKPTQGYFESVSSIASSRLSEGLSLASAQFSSQPTPALEGARRQYYEAIGLAHARYSEFLGAASTAVHGPGQGTFESLASVASASAASIAAQASSGVIGSQTPWAESVASAVSGSAKAVASDASASAESAASKVSGAAEYVASQVSSGVIGSETPWSESVASQASHNWEALIAKASEQVYGAPTPWANSVYSQAGAYAAQATAQAADQYASVQALISELVVGREPDFTESVMNRFSSAYYSGIPAAVSSVNAYAAENYAAASSYAAENYDAAGSYAGASYEAMTDYAADAYASASSVVSSVFTPPPAIESVLSQANDQLAAAVESASVAVYGTQKGTYEKGTESVASVYSSIQSRASASVYGTQQASDSFLAVANSAQAAISEALFGTPTATGYTGSVTSGANSVYSSISSVASENAARAASAVSSAVYGPEQGAAESASSRLALAVDAANSKIAEIYAAASRNAEHVASKASSAATAATERVKDEL